MLSLSSLLEALFGLLFPPVLVESAASFLGGLVAFLLGLFGIA